MFGGDPFDPFSQMRRHMAEMDQMMADPFGMMNRMMGGMLGGHPMLEHDARPHHQQPQQPRRADNALDLFGGFGMGGGLMRMMDSAMNDPNSMVFTQSTCVTMGPDGRQRVVQNSTRKAGDVKETRRAVRDGDAEHVAIGHHIGDRAHFIEKKRDSDGRVRQNQKFVNLDEDDADNFNSEFKSRATRNLGGVDPFARGSSSRHRAIDSGRSGGGRARYEVDDGRHQANTTSVPIVEVPDDDADDFVPDNSRRTHVRQDGPTIRELSEEEAEMESSKRRKGLFGKYYKN